MSRNGSAPEPAPINAGMFPGPARLRPLMPLLRALPPSLAEATLAALAVGEGLVRDRRFHRASAWAAAQGATGPRRRWMALALLANHGRFVAAEAMLGVKETADLARDAVVRGGEHLRAASAGAILLGFHLGPPRTWLTLRALGYPVRFAGRLESARGDPRWGPALSAGDVVRLPEGDSRGRLVGLNRVRRLLCDGSLVYLTADGPFGREALRIELRGRPLVVRVGWLALRRFTKAPTLPVLVHRDGRRRVIVVHPPLPAPDVDAVRDGEAVREILTPLIADYVRRHPTQCRYLALPRWPIDPAVGAAVTSAGRGRPSRGVVAEQPATEPPDEGVASD